MGRVGLRRPCWQPGTRPQMLWPPHLTSQDSSPPGTYHRSPDQGVTGQGGAHRQEVELSTSVTCGHVTSQVDGRKLSFQLRLAGGSSRRGSVSTTKKQARKVLVMCDLTERWVWVRSSYGIPPKVRKLKLARVGSRNSRASGIGSAQTYPGLMAQQALPAYKQLCPQFREAKPTSRGNRYKRN